MPNETYTSGETFNKRDFSTEALAGKEFEDCTFFSCQFQEADLSNVVFEDCRFVACDLSMVTLTKAAFRDVSFNDCKLLGLQFGVCNEFSLVFRFQGCTLDHSSFYKLKIRKTVYKDCRMHGVDFTDADIAASVLDNCDLLDATFDNTVLEQADMRTAYNYTLDPDRNRIRKAKFSLSGIPGLLGKYDIKIEG